MNLLRGLTSGYDRTKDPQGALEKGTKTWTKTSLAMSTNEGNDGQWSNQGTVVLFDQLDLQGWLVKLHV